MLDGMVVLSQDECILVWILAKVLVQGTNGWLRRAHLEDEAAPEFTPRMATYGWSYHELEEILSPQLGSTDNVPGARGDG